MPLKTPSFDKQLFEKLLADLIAFASLSGDNNIALIDYVEGYFKQHNINCFFSGTDLGQQKNLLAIIDPKQNNNLSQGLLLSGHTDLVGISNQPWDTNPFQLHNSNGKYFGRGTCDMKGFLALIMSLVPTILQRKNLKKPLGFAFTYDEETNYNGVQTLIKWFKENKQMPAAVIVGEPSECAIISSHKGESYFDCKLHGLAAHSSLPENGVNAIYYACKIIQELENIYYQNKKLLKNNDNFNPPFSSLSVGTISGGSATNTVADYCQFSWEIRTIYHHDLEHILKRVENKISELKQAMQNKCKEANIELIKHYTAPPLENDENSALIKIIKIHCQNHQLQYASFGTEAGFYQQAGIDSVVWGPGSIIQAHKANEFIELNQVEKYHHQIFRVIDSYCF